MLQKFLIVLFLSVVVTYTTTSSQAFGTSIDFSKCASNPDHHCYSYSPQLNQVPPGINTNWSFDIFMPTTACNIKGTMDSQGNCNIPSLVVSNDNYTNTKNNVGVESLENIHTVSSGTNTNYCPLGLFTLTNQDGYLDRTYNNVTGLDLTAFMYPSYCYGETGKNPINGQGGSIPLPLSVTTDKPVYAIGNTMIISGTSSSASTDITIMVISPTKNIVTISQVTASNGAYSKTVQISGVLWQQTGIYTVKATQGTLSSSTNFTLSSTVPEFPVAPVALILIFSLVILLGRMVDGHWIWTNVKVSKP